MRDFRHQSDEQEECPKRLKAKALLSSETFWLFTALLLLVLGVTGRFGAAPVLLAALAGFAALAAYVIIPGAASFAALGWVDRFGEKKRLNWEMQREDLLEKWSLVVARLAKPSRERYNRQHLRVSRLGDLIPFKKRSSLLLPGEYLLWLYLKLLLARDLLEEGTTASSESSIEEQRSLILRDLDQTGLTESTRQSKNETLLILDQRMDTARSRWARIQEVESDLTRIEQKLALMFDRAAQHNILGDSGRRINFSDEVQAGASLAALTTSHVEELDSLVTAQVCA